MILDAQTLENLEILQNDEGKKEGSILSHIDKTVTPFGRRMIKEWLMRPLVRTADINERLDAVSELMHRDDDIRKISSKLKRLPDLERLLVKIHINSLAADRGAIMYENVNAKKIRHFLTALQGFKDSMNLIKGIAADEPFESSILSHITTVGQGYPDVEAIIKKFDKAFDKAEAKQKGFIIPFKGVIPAYDTADEAVNHAKAKLDRFLKRTRAKFDDSSIKYKHLGKETYQLEIAITTLKRKANALPSEWMLSGSSKKFKRYLAPEVQHIVEGLREAEHERETILKDVSREMFTDFCTNHQKWTQAVQCLAQLDCLMSLAIVSHQQTPSTRPTFTKTSDKTASFLEIRESVHPTVAGSQNISSTSFIPNDIVIGASENKARFLLVSGPNMGGKSTLLRQACVVTILAQTGCYVPAESCSLSPVDRIFTRVGANDRIMQGQSTFMVELQETANILKHATPRSLVILDELGRGTSTFDGTAIAFSVIKYLLEQRKCMTLFSTHYHKLLDEFKANSGVAMYHMACSVQEESVTFLYKFTKGVCRNSYGMNCASLAGMPESVVRTAKEMAQHFEECLAIAHGQDNKDNDDKTNTHQDNRSQIQISLISKIFKAVESSSNGLGLLKGLQSDLANKAF
mmetsp:Transcript_24375/g.43243  ORF Transcript_24375/g.43243 Transcript_24375/m.43243 type:complete len:633 (+) Transcript_24375:2-1900(+)